MQLLGEKVLIRRPVPTDAENSYRWFSNPEVTRYLPLAGKGNIPLEDCKKFIQSVITHDRPQFAISIDTTTGKAIGCGGFRSFIEEESAELSLVIGEPDYWGKGYAREAMTLLLDYGFTSLNLKQIWLIVRQDNERAIRLFKSFGFEPIESADVQENKLKLVFTGTSK